MVGFPNPKSLSEGKIEYATTPISIWDKRFVLIDEISRCNPQMQNKFLEIVLDRQLMGIPTDIKWVWATMNPLDYPGSNPLDEALAGRMGYVLQVKRIIEQPNAIVAKVVASRNHAQTPALSHWTDESRDYHAFVASALKDELKDLMYSAGQIFAGLDDHWTPVVSKYLAAFGTAMKDQNGMPLDGRRLVMIKNNIIANIAVQTVQKGQALNIQELKELCGEVIPLSIPWLATGISASFDVTKFKQAHKVASVFLESTDSLLYRIITEQDPIRKAKLFFDNRKKISQVDGASLVAGIYEPLKLTGTPEENWTRQAEIFALKLVFAQLALSLDSIPAEVIAMATKNYPLELAPKAGPSAIKLEASLYHETIKTIDLYKKLSASQSSRDIAAAYFAFKSDSSVFTVQDIEQRLEIAYEAIDNVKKNFQYLLKEKTSHVSKQSPTFNDAASEALAQIFKGTEGKGSTDGSGTDRASDQISGVAVI
jgi:hypothetical protein